MAEDAFRNLGSDAAVVSVDDCCAGSSDTLGDGSNQESQQKPDHSHECQNCHFCHSVVALNSSTGIFASADESFVSLLTYFVPTSATQSLMRPPKA